MDFTPHNKCGQKKCWFYLLILETPKTCSVQLKDFRFDNSHEYNIQAIIKKWAEGDLSVLEATIHTHEYIPLHTSVWMKTLDVETMRKSKENLLRKKANFFSLVKKKKKGQGTGRRSIVSIYCSKFHLEIIKMSLNSSNLKYGKSWA